MPAAGILIVPCRRAGADCDVMEKLDEAEETSSAQVSGCSGHRSDTSEGWEQERRLVAEVS
jgi:hypothetical protein